MMLFKKKSVKYKQGIKMEIDVAVHWLLIKGVRRPIYSS